MKIMYIDCGMGSAGDMLTAALLELLPEEERQQFVDGFNSLGIPGVEMSAAPSVKCGVRGTHVTIKVNGEEEGEETHSHDGRQSMEHTHAHSSGHAHSHNGEEHPHHHRGMSGVEHIVRDHTKLPDKIKDDAMEVYGIIAEAEGKAHGMPVSDIHFHEVGTMDAIADVTAVCILMDRIAPDMVIASPVNTGSGHVHCAHGILPVPAPATANILEGLPSYTNGIQGELCTPTGAALVRHFAGEFGSMPKMEVRAEGFGMGKKDFETANCVKVTLGESR